MPQGRNSRCIGNTRLSAHDGGLPPNHALQKRGKKTQNEMNRNGADICKVTNMTDEAAPVVCMCGHIYQIGVTHTSNEYICIKTFALESESKTAQRQTLVSSQKFGQSCNGLVACMRVICVKPVVCCGSSI